MDDRVWITTVLGGLAALLFSFLIVDMSVGYLKLMKNIF